MSRYISDTIRQQVTERAQNRCEYCLIPAENTFYSLQIDHIISLKHEGSSEMDNLALACVVCNRNKGTDLGTILKDSEPIIRFYNPRIDYWEDHFEILQEGTISPKSEIGLATIKIFGFNHPDSVLERQLLLMAGKYF